MPFEFVVVCLHGVSMPNVLVRDVPEDVHARLLAHRGAGQSLQQYLATEMRRLAERPTIDEVIEAVARGLRAAAGSRVPRT